MFTSWNFADESLKLGDFISSVRNEVNLDHVQHDIRSSESFFNGSDNSSRSRGRGRGFRGRRPDRRGKDDRRHGNFVDPEDNGNLILLIFLFYGFKKICTSLIFEIHGGLESKKGFNTSILNMNSLEFNIPLLSNN